MIDSWSQTDRETRTYTYICVQGSSARIKSLYSPVFHLTYNFIFVTYVFLISCIGYYFIASLISLHIWTHLHVSLHIHIIYTQNLSLYLYLSIDLSIYLSESRTYIPPYTYIFNVHIVITTKIRVEKSFPSRIETISSNIYPI